MTRKTKKPAVPKNSNLKSLHEAAASPKGLTKVKSLVNKDHVDINAEYDGLTAIQVAAQTGTVGIVKFLANAGAKASIADLILRAANNNNKAVLSELTQHTYNYYLSEFKDGTTLEHLAAARGDVKHIEVLLATCADDVNSLTKLIAINDNGDSVLNWANYFAQYAVVKTLLQSGKSSEAFIEAMNNMQTEEANYDLARAYYLSALNETDVKTQYYLLNYGLSFLSGLDSQDEDIQIMLGYCTKRMEAIEALHPDWIEKIYNEVYGASGVDSHSTASTSDELHADAVSHSLDDKTDTMDGLSDLATSGSYQRYVEEDAVSDHFSFGGQAASEASFDTDEQAFLKTALQAKAEPLGFEIVDVPADGNCFYHAVVDQLKWHPKYKHLTISQLRDLAIGHIVEHRAEFEDFCIEGYRPGLQNMKNANSYTFEDYVIHQSKSNTYADHLMILALAKVLNINIYILDDKVNLPPMIVKVKHDTAITIGFDNESQHYYSLLFRGNVDQLMALENIISEVKINELIDSPDAEVNTTVEDDFDDASTIPCNFDDYSSNVEGVFAFESEEQSLSFSLAALEDGKDEPLPPVSMLHTGLPTLQRQGRNPLACATDGLGNWNSNDAAYDMLSFPAVPSHDPSTDVDWYDDTVTLSTPGLHIEQHPVVEEVVYDLTDLYSSFASLIIPLTPVQREAFAAYINGGDETPLLEVIYDDLCGLQHAPASSVDVDAVPCFSSTPIIHPAACTPWTAGLLSANSSSMYGRTNTPVSLPASPAQDSLTTERSNVSRPGSARTSPKRPIVRQSDEASSSELDLSRPRSA